MRDKRFKNLYYYNTYDFLENRRLGLLPDCSPGFAVSNQKRQSERFLALNTKYLRGEKAVEACGTT